MKIYKISALSIPYNFKYGDSLIKDCQFDFIEYNSTYEKALKELEKLQKSLTPDEAEDYLRFFIEVLSVDENKFSESFEFDFNLNLIKHWTMENTDAPFFGIKKDSNKYKKGDIVEFLMGNSLLVGIVSATPFTEEEIKKRNLSGLDQYDNCYLILYLSSDPRDTHPHDHTMESNIIGKKIHFDFSKEEKKRLEEKLSQIK